MSVKVERIKAEDLRYLADKKAKTYVGTVLTEKQIESLEAEKYSYSIFVDGTLKACAGIAEYWPGRGESWAVIDPDCKKDFLVIHNVVRRFFEICPMRRIEAAVDCSFEAGLRWVKMLGFKLEAERLQKYLPDGKDVSLFSRVRED